MRINNIYAACEGEGALIGRPQVFVRTQGCSLHCKNCDTLSSWNPKHGEDLTIEEIVQRVHRYGLNSVSITGGNPLEADGILDLVGALKQEGCWINIEVTGQDFDREVFDTVDFISCDIKTPCTEVKADIDNVREILRLYNDKMQLKLVLATEEDLEFIVDKYYLLQNALRRCSFVVTPSYTERDTTFDFSMIKKAYERVLKDKLNIRIILQQHKIVYGSQREDV